MTRFICIIIGYLVGCISMGFIVSRLTNVDLRKTGSGNIGTTNALRVLGFKLGAVTFIGDILKSMLAFIICIKAFPLLGITSGVYAFLGVILGHDFPFYLKFKGGKGIAATIGFVICIGVSFSPAFAIVTILAGVICVLIWNFISLGSIVFSVMIIVMSIVCKIPIEEVIIISTLSLLAIWQHRTNIKRLVSGTENKFSLHKSV